MSSKPRRFVRRSVTAPLSISESDTNNTIGTSEDYSSQLTLVESINNNNTVDGSSSQQQTVSDDSTIMQSSNTSREEELGKITSSLEGPGPVSPIQSDETPDTGCSGSNIHVVVSSPKKKRRFYKNVKDSQDTSSLNNSFSSDSIIENNHPMVDGEGIINATNVKDTEQEKESPNLIHDLENKEEKDTSITEVLEEEMDLNNEEVKEVEPVKQAKKPRKKKGRKSTPTVLSIDSTNCVTIGGKKFPVKKLSRRLIVNLIDIIPEIHDMDDLPYEITEIMEEYPEFFDENRLKIKQTCFLNCPIKATNKEEEDVTIEIMFTPTTRQMSIVSFYCHFCKTKQGCRMICDNANISNKREFYESHNLKPDPNFHFISRLPCLVVTCKDCFNLKKCGDFDHYLYNGNWICTHCRFECNEVRCSRKSGIDTSVCKYNGRNALEHFKMMAGDKSELSKLLAASSSNNVKDEEDEEDEERKPSKNTRGKRGRKPSVKKQIKVESSESEEEEDVSEEEEEEVKITKRVTRSTKARSSSPSSSSTKAIPSASSSSSSSQLPSKKPKQEIIITPPQQPKEGEEIQPTTVAPPTINPFMKREMAIANAKQIARYLIGAFSSEFTVNSCGANNSI